VSAKLNCTGSCRVREGSVFPPKSRPWQDSASRVARSQPGAENTQSSISAISDYCIPPGLLIFLLPKQMRHLMLGWHSNHNPVCPDMEINREGRGYNHSDTKRVRRPENAGEIHPAR
jgi:hypothetical protein